MVEGWEGRVTHPTAGIAATQHCNATSQPQHRCNALELGQEEGEVCGGEGDAAGVEALHPGVLRQQVAHLQGGKGSGKEGDEWRRRRAPECNSAAAAVLRNMGPSRQPLWLPPACLQPAPPAHQPPHLGYH